MYFHRQDGKIKVHDPSRLEEILQKYFRHSKFASFQRQLNYFGFRKMAGKGKLSPCSYVNEMATEDIRSLLLIKRKTNGSAARRAAAAAATPQSLAPTTQPFLTMPMNAYAQLNFLAMQHQQLQRQVLEAQTQFDPKQMLEAQQRQMLEAQQKQLMEAHQKQMLEAQMIEAQQKQLLEAQQLPTDQHQRNLLEAHQRLLQGLQPQQQQQLMQQVAHQQLLEAAQKQLEEQQATNKVAEAKPEIGPATAALGMLPKKQSDETTVIPSSSTVIPSSSISLPQTASLLQFQPIISTSEDLLRQRLPSQASLFPDLSSARLNSLLSLNSFLGSSGRLNSEANMQSGNM